MKDGDISGEETSVTNPDQNIAGKQPKDANVKNDKLEQPSEEKIDLTSNASPESGKDASATDRQKNVVGGQQGENSSVGGQPSALADLDAQSNHGMFQYVCIFKLKQI